MPPMPMSVGFRELENGSQELTTSCPMPHFLQMTLLATSHTPVYCPNEPA